MEINGYNLTIKAIEAVVLDHVPVTISREAYQRIETSYQVVLDIVKEGRQAIYGLTTGLGKNKDQRIPAEALEDFNRQLIYAHCVGIEPELSVEDVRAAMLVHLNGLVKGYAGVQKGVADLLAVLLNQGITPVVNGKGSIGEGDIGILSYIGLALIGEGLADYQGKRYLTGELFDKLGITPLKLSGKDGLAIISSNAVSFGHISLLLPRLTNLLHWFDLSYSLSLEALNGNITPLDTAVVKAKHHSGHRKSATHIIKALRGSYLQKKTSTTVQDPLSYRNATIIHGAVYDSIKHLERQLLKEFISSTDNPMVDTETRRIISTPHFETISISLAVEMLNLSLSHLSRACIQRMLRLGNPEFTSLSRFLTANDQQYFGLQALQKTAATLDIEIHHAASSLSNISYPLAGDMEDRQTNLPILLNQLDLILDKLQDLLAIELLHATQAISLRFSDKKPLGYLTKIIYQDIEGRYGIITDHHQVYQNIRQVSDYISQTCIRSLFASATERKDPVSLVSYKLKLNGKPN